MTSLTASLRNFEYGRCCPGTAAYSHASTPQSGLVIARHFANPSYSWDGDPYPFLRGFLGNHRQSTHTYKSTSVHGTFEPRLFRVLRHWKTALHASSVPPPTGSISGNNYLPLYIFLILINLSSTYSKLIFNFICSTISLLLSTRRS